MPFGKKKILKDFFQFGIVTILKKYHPSGNLKFNYLGIFQSFKLRTLMGKILSISLKLNFYSKYFGLLWVNKKNKKTPFGSKMSRTSNSGICIKLKEP